MRTPFCAILLSLAAAADLPPAAQADDPPAFRPPAFQSLFTAEERAQPHVQARSFPLYDFPFLDGQWEGLLCDSAGVVWFGVSTHSGVHHAQLFRYDPARDQVDHVADLGQAVGEKLAGLPPQDKIHSAMFQDGDLIYCGTCDGHAATNSPYRGGYWLAIHRKTGEVENLGKTVTGDGLICVGFDPVRRVLYGHTNHKGLLTRFDPATREERILGMPWKDSGAEWPRGLTLMIAPDGRVFGAKQPGCSFWEYDPATGQIRGLEVTAPLPADVAAGDKKAVEKFRKSAAHLTLWDATDQCFYLIRSYDEMLCRFFPPAQGRPARLETVAPIGLPGEHRYGQRHAACTLAMRGRTVYYTPYTGWGGVAHLVRYDLAAKAFADLGPLLADGDRRVCEVQSMALGPDGRLFMVGFVYSVDGVDPVRKNAMRDKYPFHPRFLIADPGKAVSR